MRSSLLAAVLLSYGALLSNSHAQSISQQISMTQQGEVTPLAEGYWSGWILINARGGSEVRNGITYTCRYDTYVRYYYIVSPTNGELIKKNSEQKVEKACW